MKRKLFLTTTHLLLSPAIFFLVLFTLSCDKMPLTNGDVVNETRQLTDFNKIHISGNIDINLIKSDSCLIEITAGENLIPNIVSDVIDDILIINNDNIGDMFRDNDFTPSANIYYKSDIYEIYYRSIGDLRSNDYINNDSLSVFDFNIEDGSGDINLKLRCNNLNINYYGGSSLVNIEGRCDSLSAYRKGLGPIHLEEMPARTANVVLYRGNDIYVSCSDLLSARIYDFGNIYYKGQPKIKSHISPDALGRIIPIDNQN